jgi:hypothetical protein
MKVSALLEYCKSYIMKRFLFIVLVTVSFNIFSQTQFSLKNHNITGVSHANAKWGDYDNDGDLDLLVTGNTYSAKIYENNGSGSFSYKSNISLTGIMQGDAVWVDIDNDNDLDIFLMGYTCNSGGGCPVIKLYKNNGNKIFSEITGHGISAVISYGGVDWGDYDNDGDLDLLVVGSSATYLYRNEGNLSFTKQTGISFLGLVGYGTQWADLNNDGYLDIIYKGWVSGTSYDTVKIYKNNGNGTFTDQGNTGILGLEHGNIDLGDYDADGDLDIAICGRIGSGNCNPRRAKIYRNNGSFNFTELTGLSLPDVEMSWIKWIDYDNDGDLDIHVGGAEQCGSAPFHNKIYRNNGNGNFTLSISSLIAMTGSSGVDWGDYDNDGDMDLVIVGATFIGNQAFIYENTSNVTNKIPTSPANLSSTVVDDDVTLTWNSAYDTSANNQRLLYNIYIGTDINSVDIVSSMSELNTGWYKNTRLPNSGLDTFHFIKNLSPGRYYWAVQAVDNCKKGGSFSTIDSFDVLDLQNGLLHYYTLDNTLNDSKGSNHGTNFGATLTTDRFGNANQAYSFDGVNDYISVPNTPDVSNSGFTFNKWVYVNSNSSWNTQGITWDGFGNDDYAFFYIDATLGRLRVHVRDPNGKDSVVVLFADTYLQVDKWMMLTMKMTSNGDLYFYVNGVKVAENTTTFSGLSNFNHTNGAWYFGKQSHTTTASWFSGKVDDVRFYNRPLSSNEISQLYGNFSQPNIINQPISQSASIQDTVSFIVEATGSNLSYQWQKNNTNISGATNDTLIIYGVQTSDAGNYRCIVSNSYGADTSDQAILSLFDLTNGLLHYYTLDNNLNDSKGSNHWTNYGSINNSSGKISSSREFNNGTTTGQYCEAGSVSLDSAASLSFWVYSYTSNQSTSSGIIFKAYGSPHGDQSLFGCQAVSDSFIFNINQSNSINLSIYRKIIQSNWTHYVLVYDGAAQKFHVYENGVKYTISTSGSQLYNPTTKLKMGMQKYASRSFSGEIDEIGVWDRALTDSEVSTLYNSGNGLQYPFTQSNSAPVITSHPNSQTVSLNDTATFTVSASGSNLSYQWQKNNTNISGATNDTLLLYGVQTSDVGNYRCIVSNNYGADTSDQAYLNVLTLDSGLVVYYPFNGNNNDSIGNNNLIPINNPGHTFNKRLTNDGSLYLNPAENEKYLLSNSNLTLDYSKPNTISVWAYWDGDNFYNEGSAGSSTTTPHGGLLSQTDLKPNGTSCSNSDRGMGLFFSKTNNNVIFKLDNIGCSTNEKTLASSNNSITSNQWYLITVSNDGNGKVKLFINGEKDVQSSGFYTSSTVFNQKLNVGRWSRFTYSAQYPVNNGNFYFSGYIDDVRIYNRTLSEYEISQLYGNFDKPNIITQPISQSASIQDTVSFIVEATGSNLSYQWQKNNSNISGATNDTLLIYGVQNSDAGNYRCIVSNTYGADTSNNASLSLNIVQAGTYTIDPSGNGDYTNIASAISDMANNGISGSVIFKIKNGTYSEQISIPSISGASATNTITFESFSGNKNDAVIQYAATSASLNYTVNFNGADYVTFRNLTIKATGTNYGTAVKFGNNADYNTLNNVNIYGKRNAYSGDRFSVVYSYQNSSYTTISNSNIYGGSIGINMIGPGWNYKEPGTAIDSNVIDSFSSLGINMQYQRECNVRGNYIHVDNSTGLSNVRGLLFTYSDSIEDVTNNQIIMEADTSYFGIMLNACENAVDLPSNFSNNMVSVKATAATTLPIGIYSLSTYYHNFYNNTVYLYGSNTSSRAFYHQSGGGIRVENSILYNNAAGFALMFLTGTGTIEHEYNALYTNGSYLLANSTSGTGFYNDLTTWQGVAFDDYYSVIYEPTLVSNTDLHIDTTDFTSVLINGVGRNAGIATDIDGEARGTTHDIGADQFDPGLIPGEPITLVLLIRIHFIPFQSFSISIIQQVQQKI